MPRKVAPQCRAVKRDRAARTGRVDYVLEAKRRACVQDACRRRAQRPQAEENPSGRERTNTETSILTVQDCKCQVRSKT